MVFLVNSLRSTHSFKSVSIRHVLFLLFSETTAGECKRRNEFAEWHVVWLAE